MNDQEFIDTRHKLMRIGVELDGLDLEALLRRLASAEAEAPDPKLFGDGGAPLDVLVLMDEPAFTGCLVRVRLLGVIEAEQTERGGETARNDRLIAVASKAYGDAQLRSLKKIDDELMKEIEHFFVSYNEFKGKRFKPLGRYGPARAVKAVEAGVERYGGRNGAGGGRRRARSNRYLL